MTKLKMLDIWDEFSIEEKKLLGRCHPSKSPTPVVWMTVLKTAKMVGETEFVVIFGQKVSIPQQDKVMHLYMKLQNLQTQKTIKNRRR